MNVDRTDRLIWTAAYAPRADRIKASEIRELLRVLERPEVISLAGGIPDPALFPADAFRSAYDAILGSELERSVALQYAVTEGYAPLRSWIADYMGMRGTPCSTDNILVTAGSQQALDLIAKLFVSRNDTVLVTAPTYLGALQVFNAYEARYDTLNLMEINASHYRRCAAVQNSRVRAAYAVSDFSNPTGESLSLAERSNLLELGRHMDIPIIEDAAYEALRFDGEPAKSCQALELAECGSIERSRVIYCGSFSKTTAPGLRLGWICAAREVVRKLTLIKQGADLHVPQINQMVMHRVVSQIFLQQCHEVRSVYRLKRDAMLSALGRFMPGGVTWARPEGGMFVWLTLPETLDGVELLSRALDTVNVAFVPGSAFYARDPRGNTLRLNYSRPSLEDIEAGVKRLASVIGRTTVPLDA